MERGTLCSKARPPNIAKTCSPLLYFDLGGKEGALVCKAQLLSGSVKGDGADLWQQGRRGCPRGLPERGTLHSSLGRMGRKECSSPTCLLLMVEGEDACAA